MLCNDTRNRILKGKFVRRTIHASGVFVPVVSILIGKINTVVILSALSIIYLASEYMRTRGRTLPLMNRLTKIAIRSEEKTSRFVLAPLSLALGVSASLLIFPTPISYASIAIVGIGDVVASTAGGAVGRRRIPYNHSKSIEGSIIGAAAAIAVSLLFVSPILAVVGSVVGMLVESLPLRVNDNSAIPILAGIAMVGGQRFGCHKVGEPKEGCVYLQGKSALKRGLDSNSGQQVIARRRQESGRLSLHSQRICNPELIHPPVYLQQEITEHGIHGMSLHRIPSSLLLDLPTHIL